MPNRVDNIYIMDGRIMFRNFSGNPNKNYNHDNKRTVTFVISEEIKDKLIQDGWYVKPYIPKNDPDAGITYILEATVCYRTKEGLPKDPNIFIIRPDGLLHVTEDIVDQLDGMDIVSVDATLGPSYWKQGNSSGIRAYVNKMLVTVRENPIDRKYREYAESMNKNVLPTDGDLDLPFPVD